MTRYIYAMFQRPPGPGCQPMEGLFSVDTMESAVEGRHSWGHATYIRELTAEETEHYDMELVMTEIE